MYKRKPLIPSVFVYTMIAVEVVVIAIILMVGLSMVVIPMGIVNAVATIQKLNMFSKIRKRV